MKVLQMGAALLVTAVVVLIVLWRIRREDIRTDIERVSSNQTDPPGISPIVKPLTADALLQHYRERGFAEVAESLRGLTRPCLTLSKPGSVDSSRPHTRSHIGGTPTLSDSGMWPKWKGKSLAMIAQIDLGEIPADAFQGILPDRGLLLFFYDVEQSTWGFDPKDKGSWQVLYVEQPVEPDSSVDYPADLPPEGRYTAVPVVGRIANSIPDPSRLAVWSKLNKKHREIISDAYHEFMGSVFSGHHLLGFPDPIQDNEMDLECQLASHGIYCGDDKGSSDPRVKALESGAEDWILLLQVDSDDDAGMMWGDVGRLYFWINRDDLKNRRFDNVWMILQCC